jgi:hypothetical protein
MHGIRFAKEKGRMIAAARARRGAGLAIAVVIPIFIGARTTFGADQVHDEMQVYNAEIRQWTYQQHLNYAATNPECREAFRQITPSKGRRNSPMV